MSKIEKHIENYPNGQKKEAGHYLDGEKEGLWTRWSEYGRREHEGVYKEGELIKSTAWDFYTGVKTNEAHFNGVDNKGRPILDGKLTAWNAKGQKLIVTNYKDGKTHGLMTKWYANGQKWSEATLKDGKPYGLGTTWYANGQKWSEETYKNGELISEKCWDEDGYERECYSMKRLWIK